MQGDIYERVGEWGFSVENKLYPLNFLVKRIAYKSFETEKGLPRSFLSAFV